MFGAFYSLWNLLLLDSIVKAMSPSWLHLLFSVKEQTKLLQLPFKHAGGDGLIIKIQILSITLFNRQ